MINIYHCDDTLGKHMADDAVEDLGETLTLVQTREITVDEAASITDAATSVSREAPLRDGSLRLYRYIFWGSLALVVMSFIRFMDVLGDQADAFPVFGRVAFLVAIYLWLLIRTRYRRLVAARNQALHQLGDRYSIDHNGLTVDRPGRVTSFFPWLAVDGVRTTSLLFLVQYDTRAVVLPTTAFAEQNVEHFCTELERRWRSARAVAD